MDNEVITQGTIPEQPQGDSPPEDFRAALERAQNEAQGYRQAAEQAAAIALQEQAARRQAEMGRARTAHMQEEAEAQAIARQMDSVEEATAFLQNYYGSRINSAIGAVEQYAAGQQLENHAHAVMQQYGLPPEYRQMLGNDPRTMQLIAQQIRQNQETQAELNRRIAEMDARITAGQVTATSQPMVGGGRPAGAVQAGTLPDGIKRGTQEHLDYVLSQ